MFNTLKIVAIAGFVSLGALAAMPAKADNVYLNFGDSDASFGVYAGDTSRMHYPHDYYRGDYHRSYRYCTPEHALYKAQRIGVHHARIDYVSRREIGIVGRSRGERVHLTFARAPRCPIIG
jgi:hypothetical protein